MSPRQQRCAVAAAIIGAHALAVLLGLRLLPVSATPEPEEALTYITAFIPQPRRAAPPRTAAAAESRAERPQLLPAPDRAAALSSPERKDHVPIGWDSEAGRAAHGVVDSLVRSEPRKCDDSPEPGSWLPKCHKSRPRFEWNAEPRQAGFESGLPYVRLGKHCVLIMGLVGCQIGEIAPNGHLFDDMKDPDRDRSSVPDIADINEPAGNAALHPSVLRKPDRPTSVMTPHEDYTRQISRAAASAP